MIDVNKLKQLREETGVSYSLCKKALVEAKGNIEKAKEILYKHGAERVNKKLQKTVHEGALFSYIHHNKKIASLVELLCETDFVARTQEFQLLGQELAMQIAFSAPADTEKLLDQEYIKDPKKKIGDLVKEHILTLGENIKINRIIRWQIGE